jgi:hypothetical protein
MATLATTAILWHEQIPYLQKKQFFSMLYLNEKQLCEISQVFIFQTSYMKGAPILHYNISIIVCTVPEQHNKFFIQITNTL